MFTNSGSDDVLDELKHTPPPPPPATASQRSQPSKALNLNFPMVGEGARLTPKKEIHFYLF
jgi:hypothetical protein